MEYNRCSTCGAGDGRCGVMFITVEHGEPECENCYDTRRTGDVVIHTNLTRTHVELLRTMDIPKEKP